MQIPYTSLIAKSQMKWRQAFCSFSGWGYGSSKSFSVGLAVLTLPPIFLFSFCCYHLRNPFIFDECSVAEITLHYGRAFDSLDACVRVPAWAFHYRRYWFRLSSLLWAALYTCHLTDDEYIAHLVVSILFHRKTEIWIEILLLGKK